MGLNKQKGNMYGFVTHTWNPIKGRCIHNCNYCYMHRIWDRMDDIIKKTILKYQGSELRLDEKELKTDLGEGNFIFVGSSTDMWAENIPAEWITKIFDYIRKYPENTYLFQTKNPKRFAGWTFGDNVILAITLENTYQIYSMVSNAPDPHTRAIDFSIINHSRKMITIEPIFTFNLEMALSYPEEIG